MSVTGERDDLPGGGPQKVGVAVADLFTGMYATVAILAALRHRDLTGEGQAIDMALLDTQVAMLANLGANYLVTGNAPKRAGNAHQNIVPYQVFEVADGHLILAVGNDGQFARFCQVAGRPDLAQDPRFATNAERVRQRDVLVPLLTELMRSRSKADWMAALEAAKVPCGPINDLQEVFADPQVKHRGMKVRAAAPVERTNSTSWAARSSSPRRRCVPTGHRRCWANIPTRCCWRRASSADELVRLRQLGVI